MKILRWKFMNGGFMSNNGDCTWEKGKWKKHNGNIVMCEAGFHCSKKVYHAFSYVQGEILARVECRGKNEVQDDKEVYSEMRMVKAYKWQKKDSVALSIYAAELVIENFEKVYPNDKRPREAIEAVKRYLKNPTEKNKAAAESAAESAYSAARSAARSAYSAAWSAARSAAESAYSAARSAAESAYSAARSAARSAAWSAYSAAESAAWSAYSAAESAYSAAESAYSAAESAAWSAYSAARSAAESAARSAAWSAYSAARSAAESAARSDLIKKICIWMDEHIKELEEIK